MIRQQRLHHDFHLTEIMNPNRTITLHSYARNLEKNKDYPSHNKLHYVDVEVKDADGKVQQILCPEITRYKVICGSNGKVGTRFNTVIIPKEQKGRVIVKETIDNGSVGRKLTDKEFVELYPKQCNIFKEIFKEEYKALTKK